MPELPEVEGVVRSLAPLIEGKFIERIEISPTLYNSRAQNKQAIIKGIELSQFIEGLQHAEIQKVARRAKYIYFHMRKEVEFLFLNHLGMTGAWFVVSSIDEIGEKKFADHRHVTMWLNDGNLLVYSDIRRFGEMRLLQDEFSHEPLVHMAPEPFDENALSHFLSKCDTALFRNKTIKETIMDGRVISGCGNIYAAEALFRVKLKPIRKVSSISKAMKIKLFHEIVSVLQESIKVGGSSISDYRNVNGGAGAMQHFLQMYGKKYCITCHKETKRKVIAGRNSWYCTSCQK